MADLTIIAVMFVSAIIPFSVMARLMLAQKSGLALNVMSLLAAGVGAMMGYMLLRRNSRD